MKGKGGIQKIMMLLGLAIVGLVVYSIFVAPSGDQNGSSGLTSTIKTGAFGKVQESDVSLANAEILRVLGNIEDIELGDDIFTNPVFAQLREGGKPIPKPRRIGRPNPFKAIGFESISSSLGQSIPSTTSFGQNNNTGVSQQATDLTQTNTATRDTRSDFFSN